MLNEQYFFVLHSLNLTERFGCNALPAMLRPSVKNMDRFEVQQNKRGEVVKMSLPDAIASVFSSSWASPPIHTNTYKRECN